jgi:hypothetical protein
VFRANRNKTKKNKSIDKKEGEDQRNEEGRERTKVARAIFVALILQCILKFLQME